MKPCVYDMLIGDWGLGVSQAAQSVAADLTALIVKEEIGIDIDPGVGIDEVGNCVAGLLMQAHEEDWPAHQYFLLSDLRRAAGAYDLSASIAFRAWGAVCDSLEQLLKDATSQGQWERAARIANLVYGGNTSADRVREIHQTPTPQSVLRFVRDVCNGARN